MTPELCRFCEKRRVSYRWKVDLAKMEMEEAELLIKQGGRGKDQDRFYEIDHLDLIRKNNWFHERENARVTEHLHLIWKKVFVSLTLQQNFLQKQRKVVIQEVKYFFKNDAQNTSCVHIRCSFMSILASGNTFFAHICSTTSHCLSYIKLPLHGHLG